MSSELAPKINQILKLVVQPADGGDPVRVSIDVFEAWPAAGEIWEKHPDLEQRADAWVEWLVSKGMPRLSRGEAGNVFAQIAARIGEMKRQCAERKQQLVEEGIKIVASALDTIEEINAFITEELPKREAAGLLARGGDGASQMGPIPGFPRRWPPRSTD